MENDIEKKVVQNVYNEVYGILLAFGDSFIAKVPEEVLKNITRNMSYTIKNGQKKYDIPKYNLKVSLNIQGVSKEALAIIYYIYYNYWCVSEKEKKYLETLIKNNEIKQEKEKIEKYGNDELFKKEKMENMLITTEERKWYQKIMAALLRMIKSK